MRPASAEPPLARPSIGTQAPDIVLPTLDGNEWRLEDQCGRTVVVIFHRHAH